VFAARCQSRFEVGRFEKGSKGGGRWFGASEGNDDDGGQKGNRRVWFEVYGLVLGSRHLLGARFGGWEAGGMGTSRGDT
jgi:hypothetical protein